MLRIPSSIDETTEAVSATVIDSALAVHGALGPGLFESAYERALCLELAARNVSFRPQQPIEVHYRDAAIRAGRVDLIVENAVIVELKSVARLEPVHVSQAVAYLRATGLRLALVINFNVVLLRQGVRRVVL